MMEQIDLKICIEDYLDHINHEYSMSTGSVYRQALNLFMLFIQDTFDSDIAKLTLTDISMDAVKNYHKFLQTNRSIETEHLYSRALIDFLKYQKGGGELDREIFDIVTYVEEKRRNKTHKIPDLPIESIETMLTRIKSYRKVFPPKTPEREVLRFYRDKAYILLLSETGLRVSEICSLAREDFDPALGVLVFEVETMYQLTPETTDALSLYISSRGVLDGAQAEIYLADLPLFARHDKKSGNKVLPLSRWTGRNIISDWVSILLSEDEMTEIEERGQQISPQTLRHYFVIRQLSDFEDITVVQKLARHSEVSTTKKYLSD